MNFLGNNDAHFERAASPYFHSQPASPRFVRDSAEAMLREMTNVAYEQGKSDASIVSMITRKRNQPFLALSDPDKQPASPLKVMDDGRQPGESLVEFRPISKSHSPIPMHSPREIKLSLHASTDHYRPKPQKQLHFFPISSSTRQEA
eukprot:m.32522 g.32522  ORF g.32522 m.32522 type:complete len:147 (-) comp10800_c0_seq1:108-548(-)